MAGPSWGALERKAAYGVILAGFACSASVEPTSASLDARRHFAPAPVLYQTWSKTEELVRDPQTRTKVEALATATMRLGVRSDGTMGLEPTIEAEAIGIDGAKSKAWSAFRELGKVISPAESVALLRHESPAVRGYFAQHVGKTMPDAAPGLLYPLLGDPTTVAEASGCTTRFDSIADVVLGELTQVGAETNLEREELFAVIADDRRLATATRGRALKYLATIDRDYAHPLALAAAHDADAAWRHEGIDAVGVVGEAEDVDLVATGTTSADWHERESAVTALGKIDAPASRDKIAPLLHDPQDDVRAAAASSYAAQTCAGSDVLAALLADKEYRVASGTARKLADAGTLRALQVLEPSLMNEETPLGGFELESLLYDIGAPGIPVMRRLLSSRSSRVRDDAIHRLEALGDKASTR